MGLIPPEGDMTTMMRNSDAELALIARLRSGDASAVDDLAAAYGPKIYQLALRYMKNREDAEEVAQDVLLKVYRKISAFRGDSALSSWIYRITFNAAMSRLRNSKFSRPAEVSAEDVLGPAAIVAERLTTAGIRLLAGSPLRDVLLGAVGIATAEADEDRVVAQSAGAPVPFNAPVQDPEPEPDPPTGKESAKCAAAASTKAVDLKATTQFGIVPTFNALLIADDEYPVFQFEFGLTGHARAVIEATATLNATVSLTCKLWEAPVPITIPAPPPVGMFMAAEIGEEMTFEAQLQGQGGPSLAFKASCGLSVQMRAGFRYIGATDQLVDRNLFDPS